MDQPVDPYQFSFPYDAPPPPPPAPAPRRRGPRLVAVGTAVAVVVAAGAGGFAFGRHHDGNGSAVGSTHGFADQGNGGTTPFEGSPFNGPGGPGGAPFGSGTSGTPATTDQLTGLVRISATLKYQGGRAAGTGMILTSDGEVITNHHVVEGATRIRVTVMDTKQKYAATVVGIDSKDDVAVLQLSNASGLQTVTTDTSAASVGDAVTAVGDAGGSTSSFNSAPGKVTATGQHITTHSQDSSRTEKLHGLIEISSDVISGDSGGATYDAQGAVIGMTTAASSGNNDVVGYAIPIGTVLSIAGDLEQGAQNARYEYGTPAFLGVGLSGTGTRVADVFPGTPAASAGVTAGATITALNGTPVRTAAALRQAVTTYSPGDSVTLTWTDLAGSTHSATMTLIDGPVA
ncbi:S1C family serine protease [Nocardioides cynanchi]|uniref:S1C family serine protease n=1 Tax=Nocardioides cynanchi TaxID=2558918 RepID=UPI001243DD71|nr:trypsin-like peptidase domain-containing protein [Nocardioides cynanchi]